MPRTLVFLSFISLSASAAIFGPEIPLSPPAITSAPYEQRLTGLASNGRDFLAIWLDRRSTIAPIPSFFGSAPLYVSKLDAAGRPVNAFGAKLRDAAFNASLVWTPRGYLVFWSEKEEVDSMLLDDDGVPVSMPQKLTDGYLLAAASNGHSIFVIHGPFSQTQVASVFTPDGTLLSQTTFNPVSISPQRIKPLVMPNGDYGVVAQIWTCPGNVPCSGAAILMTISESGAVATKSLAAISTWSQTAAALGNGHLLLAWMSDNLSPPARTLMFRIFDSSGNPVTATTTLAATNAIQAITGAYGASVGWDGSTFLVAWQWPSTDEQSGEVRAVRVTTDGFVIESTPVALAQTLGNPPWFVSNGTRQLVAWDTFLLHRLTIDISLRSVPSFDALNYVPTTILAKSAALETEAQLATLGSKTFAVWREGDSSPSIAAAIVGEVPVIIAESNTLDEQAPSVGASRNQYFVVWREESPASFRILAKRIAADGAVVDHDPIVIADSLTLNSFFPVANTLAVGSNGTDFFIVWPAVNDRLLAARVTADGKVLDTPPIDVSQPPNGTSGSPRVVWTGSEYIVAWTADPSCKLCLSPPGPPISQIFIARIGADGKSIDSKKIWNGGYGSRMAIARGADGLMLAWPVSSGAGAACIYAMALGNNALPAGSIQTVTCAQPMWPRQFPDFDLTWDGAAFLAAWTELTSTGATAKAIHVSTAAIPIEPDPFELAPASFQPALSSSGSGVMIAYSRIANEPQYGGVARVFARAVDALSRTFRHRAVR